MEKQHNRGQDGAGVASVKLNIEPGHPFLKQNPQHRKSTYSKYFFKNF